jgi:hypothetical protein
VTRSERFAVLADWARRDHAFGMRQAQLEEAQFPGIVQEIQDYLDLDEEFARAKGNWSMVVDEKARMAVPRPTPAPVHHVSPARSSRRKARA